MITVFNRKELTITFDMKKQAEIRDLLALHKIPYTVNVINRKSPSPMAAGSRARTGTWSEDLTVAYEYIFYVKKTDYQKAADIISPL